MIPHVPVDEGPDSFAPFVHQLRLIAEGVLYGNGDPDWETVQTQESTISPADDRRFDRFVIRTKKWIRRDGVLFRIEFDGTAEKGRTRIVISNVRFPELPGAEPEPNATDLIVDQD